MQQFIRDSWTRVLQATALRNGRAALRRAFDGDESQAPPRFASRLLQLGPDGTILVERPMKPGAAALCQPRARVDLMLPDGPQCWAGRCGVVGRLTYPLNRTTTVYAVRLTGPTRVWSAQRRRFYRVCAAGSELQSAYVVPEQDAADGPEADGFEAAVFDLSGGGVGLRIAARGALARRLSVGMALRCVLHLPGETEAIDLPAALCRVQRVDGDLLHLGLAFDLDATDPRHRLADRVTRYATRLEREQLQRQRGA